MDFQYQFLHNQNSNDGFQTTSNTRTESRQFVQFFERTEMINTHAITDLKARLEKLPRFQLALLPTPLHRLKNFEKSLGGPDLWIKRDDLTGFEGGGNKTRKLEFLVGEAIHLKADMLVTIGAIQSNHTRQTAAAAAKSKLKCALLHCAWTKNSSPHYRKVGNLLLSHLMGADLYIEETERPIEDQSPLQEFFDRLKQRGNKPYLIPGGASEHWLGSMGYVNCALELASQCLELGFQFDYLLHCTGSGSTQAGLLAGIAALGLETRVIGVSDDHEVNIKKARIKQLANQTLQTLGLEKRVSDKDVEVVPATNTGYGVPDKQMIDSIRRLAKTEGLIADPVYEGRAVTGLLNLANDGRFEKDAKVLLMHLGGSPAIHAYAEQFGAIDLKYFASETR